MDEKTIKEIKDVIDKYSKLEEQKRIRHGMEC